MQPIERRMNENVPAAPGRERRRQADMAEAHPGDTLELSAPCIKRTRNERVKVVYPTHRIVGQSAPTRGKAAPAQHEPTTI